MNESRWMVYLFGWGAILLSILLGVIVITLWAYITYIALAILLIGGGVVGLEVFMRYERHKVDIEARRNRAILVHESEHGYGYVKGGEVIGYSHRLSQGPTMYPALPGFDPVVPEPPRTPETFGEMVQSGYIAPGLDYVLGFDEGADPIRMPALTSLGVGGVPGAGKTVTDLSIMLQTIIKSNGRVRFLMVDPHMGASGDESLAAKARELTPFFLTLQDVRTTVAQDDREYHSLLDAADQFGLSGLVEGREDIRYWLSILDLEFDRRMHGKSGELWVLMVDEFASLMTGDLAKPIAELIEKINREARKVGMFCVLTSQEWKATRTGGTELRHTIASFIAHNMPEAISGLILPGEYAKQTPTLDVGEVLVWNRGKVRRGRVPLVTGEDARRVTEEFYPRSLVQITEVAE